jgi:hypothetical protein
MVTPTYRPGVTYDPRQISRTLNALKMWAAREGHFVYWVWRMEFGEQTGRLHYHVMIWLPEGAYMPRWDEAGWWPHGMTKTEVARSPVGYMAKYASKQARFVGETTFNTKGARWWGARLPPDVRFLVRLRLAPLWVQDKWEQIGGVLKRGSFGWWRIGAFEFRSPWEMVSFGALDGVKVRWRGWDQFDFVLLE